MRLETDATEEMVADHSIVGKIHSAKQGNVAAFRIARLRQLGYPKNIVDGLSTCASIALLVLGIHPWLAPHG